MKAMLFAAVASMAMLFVPTDTAQAQRIGLSFGIGGGPVYRGYGPSRSYYQRGWYGPRYGSYYRGYTRPGYQRYYYRSPYQSYYYGPGWRYYYR